MIKIATSAFATAFFLTAGIAQATLFDVAGRIRSIDTSAHEFRLTSGQYYIVPPDVSLEGLKVGDTVMVTVHNYHDGINYVKTITKTK